MGVQTGQAHTLGRNQKFFASVEGTSGTFSKPSATDAIKTETSTMKNDEVSEPVMHPSDYRYPEETVQDKATASWAWDGYMIPSGVAANEWDLGAFFRALFGAHNSGAGSQWEYTIASVQTWPTLSLTRHFNSIWQEAMWGGWIQKGSIKLAGGQQPRAHFEGGAMGYAFTGNALLDAAISGANDFSTDPEDRWKFNVGSVVQIDDQTDREVTAVVDRAAGTFTVDGSALTEADDDPIVPYVPTPSYQATAPISGVLGSIKVDDLSGVQETLRITAAELSIENNHDVFADEVFSKYPSDFAPDWVNVSLSIDLRVRQDFIEHIANYLGFAVTDLEIICGSVAGSRFKLDLGNAELKSPDVSIPKDKSGTVKLTYTGLGSGATGPVTLTTY